MKKLTKTDIIVLIVMAVAIICVVAAVSGGFGVKSDNEAVSTKAPEEIGVADYSGREIGVQTGTMYDEIIKEHVPDAKISYFNSYTDMIAALEAHKIDGFGVDEAAISHMMAQDKSIDYVKEYMTNYGFGFAFAKSPEGEALCKEFSDYIIKIKEDGTLSEMSNVWFGDDESKKTIPEFDTLSGEKGTIVVAEESANMPYVYVKNNRIIGFEIDMLYRFCEESGYGLELSDMNFGAVIPAVSTGKCDIGCSSIAITDERKKSVNFSEPYYEGGSVLAVRASDLSGGDAASEGSGSFIDSIKESFYNNFILEDRYILILQGIKTTCILTLFSVFFGSILAFLICLFRRADSVLSEKLCNLYVKLMQGTPMIVLLMILYYIVFGHSEVEAAWVAVIGFSLNFAAYVSEILRSGIASVDKGQREAALALGFSENQAFYSFIFPQAALRQVPVYRGEIISLLKNTSIVGYIAIQDLTKMSDIIRSRTFEAFFPLIVTAMIYFFLAWVITKVLNLVLIYADPKARSTGYKGVR